MARRRILLCGFVVLSCSSSTTPPAATPGSDAGDEADADAGVDAGPPPIPCNGHVELCDKHFDEVAYPCTHNAYAAAEYGFQPTVTNQTRGLAKQLDDGVRCMMLDIYDDNGVRALCHDTCGAGKKDHLEALAAIKSFLDAHPNEVLTLDYEDYVPATTILADLTTAGLGGMLQDVDPTAGGWPTLRAMIAANKRLVVGIEGKTTTSDPPKGIYEFYAIAWDTPYRFEQPTDFSCSVNRGVPGNALFLVNHWLSTSVGLPDMSKASVANAYDTLYGHAKTCADSAHDFPNFLAVDFYDTGDLFRAVATLNGF